MVTKKKDHFDIDEHIKELRGAEKKTDFEKLLLQISDEFDRGDFSSLDPQFIEDMKKAGEVKGKKKRTSQQTTRNF